MLGAMEDMMTCEMQSGPQQTWGEMREEKAIACCRMQISTKSKDLQEKGET